MVEVRQNVPTVLLHTVVEKSQNTSSITRVCITVLLRKYVLIGHFHGMAYRYAWYGCFNVLKKSVFGHSLRRQHHGLDELYVKLIGKL
jgi:hypothetical protein